MLRLLNVLTAFMLLLTLAAAVWMAAIFSDPKSSWNPFPPPTAAAEAHSLPAMIATALPTVASIPPSATPLPTASPPPSPTDTAAALAFTTAVEPTAPNPLDATPSPQTAVGGFELGGQVAGFNDPDRMKYAGMTWVKRQLRWRPGANPNDAAGYTSDNLYVQGMVSAGALSYLDCLGMHYNEGIVPPSQSSGDPRGSSNHYTRYYSTMINTYYSAAGGRKKLCFTELGYLSGDGYSPALADAAPGFAWAAGTSVDEQAQWLADAVRTAMNSPRVRLIVVLNVAFTASGSDPQGRYAIIRPGGGCPACDSLHAVTGGR